MIRAAAPLAFVAAFAVAAPTHADVSSSDVYSLGALNQVAGGGSGSSANYESELTGAAAPVGAAASENYSIELIPVPEPSRATLLLFGTAMLFWLSKWHHSRLEIHRDSRSEIHRDSRSEIHRG